MPTTSTILSAAEACRRASLPIRHYTPGSTERERLQARYGRLWDKYQSLLSAASDDVLCEVGTPAAMHEIKRRQSALD